MYIDVLSTLISIYIHVYVYFICTWGSEFACAAQKWTQRGCEGWNLLDWGFGYRKCVESVYFTWRGRLFSRFHPLQYEHRWSFYLFLFYLNLRCGYRVFFFFFNTFNSSVKLPPKFSYFNSVCTLGIVLNN